VDNQEEAFVEVVAVEDMQEGAFVEVVEDKGKEA